ncbi:S23 ribosomal protein [Candidatus Sulfotelmatobacter kueseliae]|uniref:S23 ribosomal protein n=1 Tax=Candidatus Sulfotelmatobacter kueseliae TaxID=2042962 RepID=A0A2U3KB69_9BACT|nr:S23 ribosomal protein [Candidatus Sulfotelmatobacter kueseliae]
MSQSSYKDLIAWQKGMGLVAAIYDATEGFPPHEQFGLVSQMRRAAVSVPSNIAEGKAHYSNRDFVRFLRHARGSLAEIETQVLIAQQRQYLPATTTTKLTQQLDELGRILSGLINSLKERERAQDPELGTQD